MKERWTYKKLGEVCEVISGQSPEGKYYNTERKGIPFYQGKKDFSLKYIGEPTMWTTDVTKIAEKDDLLMSVRAPVGDVNFATQRLCIGRGLAAIRTKGKVDKEYLFYFLLAKKNNIKGKEGVGFASINRKEIMDIDIHYPDDLSEQLSIVARLDAAFAHIDSLKANAEKQLAEARQLFQAELAECMKPKEGWEEKSFVNCIDKVPKQKQVKSKDYKSFGNYPIVSQEKELISGYWDDDSYLYKHERPIIIFGDHTKEIKYVDFNFVVGADGTQILSPKKGIDARFFYYALVATPLRTLGYARHFKLLKEKTFFIPPLDTQDQIVFRLDALSANIKKLEEVQRKTFAECDALKQAMLREVFE